MTWAAIEAGTWGQRCGVSQHRAMLTRSTTMAPGISFQGRFSFFPLILALKTTIGISQIEEQWEWKGEELIFSRVSEAKQMNSGDPFVQQWVLPHPYTQPFKTFGHFILMWQASKILIPEPFIKTGIQASEKHPAHRSTEAEASWVEFLWGTGESTPEEPEPAVLSPQSLRASKGMEGARGAGTLRHLGQALRKTHLAFHLRKTQQTKPTKQQQQQQKEQNHQTNKTTMTTTKFQSIHNNSGGK